MANLSVENIRSVSREILIKKQVPLEQAEIIADTIVDAHIKEKHTHGMGRLSIYVRKIDSGQMKANTCLKVIRDTEIIQLLDANNGFGQVAAYEGVQHAIKKATQYGVGIVGIKDSNSFGAAGYYGEVAAKAGMIGIIMGNSSPALAPTGGKQALLGTNPICVSCPGTIQYPHIVFDMACSVAARGKVRLAAKNGEKIPLDWAKDKNGNATDDPEAALLGSMNPIGDYKGFGLALIVDILAGLLTDSAFAGDVKALNTPKGYSRYGHFLCVINPIFFMDKKAYEEKMNYLIEQIKRTGDPGKVFLPGEKAFKNSIKNSVIVNVKESIIKDVNNLADQLGTEKLLEK